MSAGTIIESMSSRKLTYVLILLVVLQIFSFLLGAVVSPKPNGTMQYTGTKCIAKDSDA